MTARKGILRLSKKKANEPKATLVHSEADCRAKVKRLKVKYFEEKRKQDRSGNSKTNFAYWEKIDRVLGTRPISRPVSSLDSMTCSGTCITLFYEKIHDRTIMCCSIVNLFLLDIFHLIYRNKRGKKKTRQDSGKISETKVLSSF